MVCSPYLLQLVCKSLAMDSSQLDGYWIFVCGLAVMIEVNSVVWRGSIEDGKWYRWEFRARCFCLFMVHPLVFTRKTIWMQYMRQKKNELLLAGYFSSKVFLGLFLKVDHRLKTTLILISSAPKPNQTKPAEMALEMLL
ncbi:hypothetical protein L1987_50855 [Smallanthus sonchifolius]|uniref:Uncharacterized protein n=1 Tax=Smallanthus sonchifolius TaxID=185202 RepID=A0ACB9EP97_9ASTR|nr:hypothetical protein L1987_50855 [Smallanthus sonchifolius]